MRQEHRAGEKMFADFSGDGIFWFDRDAGERREAALFVAVLGASNATYAEAAESQKLPVWIQCQVHALEYFEGVPKVIVPDQPRSLISKPCRYDPELNPTYQEFARHYSTCVIPARPRHPRDKSKVEGGVLLAQRWIIAALRNRAFYSIEEINEAIDGLLDKLNSKPLRKLKRSRRELLVEVDRPALLPLPERRFEFAEWKVGVRVNMDYHVEIEKNYYSVPFQHARETVDLRATATTVEVFLRGKRVSSHVRSTGQFKYSTLREHMPRAHQEHLDWTPSRIVNWAERVGPSTARLVTTIMTERTHPEQGYRTCLGILRLAKRHTEERLEKACARAAACHSHSYRSVASILEKKLENQALPQLPQGTLPRHENLRGSSYYA
jgi:transposase